MVAEDRAGALNPVDEADQALHGGHAAGGGSGPSSRAGARIRMAEREPEDECSDGDGGDDEEIGRAHV